MTGTWDFGMHRTGAKSAVFGFVLFGGPLSGAMVRDVRLANELVERGYEVHVWWVMDRSQRVELDARIHQHWLFHGARYFPVPGLGAWARGMQEAVGRLSTVIFHDKNRQRLLQHRPWMLDRLMSGFTRIVCQGVERDSRVIQRFAAQLEAAGVTHVLPMLAALGPWVDAARQRMPHPPALTITFQGYELYSQYARQIDLEAAFYEKLRDVVRASDRPAIAVSSDYRQRVMDEIGVAGDDLVAIPPGVPAAGPGWDRAAGHAWLRDKFDFWPTDIPVITYVGRQDTEKGIDLLLYAAAILQARGVKFELFICGPTLFGSDGERVIRQIADNLRVPVRWKRYVPEEMRSALFSASRCIVYPSIHREPFGMVAAEAMAHGTPVVVPAYGGVSDVVEANGACGGLRFKVWDSGDLAEQLGRLLEDETLWRKLADDAPRAAAYFSIPRLADRVLAHVGVSAPDTNAAVSADKKTDAPSASSDRGATGAGEPSTRTPDRQEI